MLDHFKKLGRDSIIYGMGGSIKAAIGFFMLPVITRLFTVEQIGVIEMFLLVNAVLLAFMDLGISNAKTFYYYKDESPQHKRSVIKTHFMFMVFWGGAVAALAFVLSPVIDGWLFEGEAALHLFAIAFATVIFERLTSHFIRILRLQFKPYHYISLNVLLTALMYSAIIGLAVTLNIGVAAYLLGLLFAKAVVAGAGWFMLREWHAGRFSWALFKRMLGFGLPLFPTVIAVWLFHAVDRIFLLKFVSMEEVGIYAIGAKFSLLVGAAIVAFRTAWVPILYDTAKKPDANRFFSLVARVYLFVALAGCVVLTGMAPWLILLMTRPEFYRSYLVVGLLACSTVLNGFYSITGLGVTLAEKTVWITVAMSLSAVANIVLNALMIPVWGILGAATATMTAIALGNVLLLYVSERVYFIGAQPRRLAALVLTALVGIAGQLYILGATAPGGLQAAAIGLIWLATMALMLFCGIGAADIGKATQLLRTRRNKGRGPEDHETSHQS